MGLITITAEGSVRRYCLIEASSGEPQRVELEFFSGKELNAKQANGRYRDNENYVRIPYSASARGGIYEIVQSLRVDDTFDAKDFERLFWLRADVKAKQKYEKRRKVRIIARHNSEWIDPRATESN